MNLCPRLHKRSARSSSLSSIAARPTTRRLRPATRNVHTHKCNPQQLGPGVLPPFPHRPRLDIPRVVPDSQHHVGRRSTCRPGHRPSTSAAVAATLLRLSVRYTVRTAAPVHESPPEAYVVARTQSRGGFLNRRTNPRVRQVDKKSMKTAPHLRGHRRRRNKS